MKMVDKHQIHQKVEKFLLMSLYHVLMGAKKAKSRLKGKEVKTQALNTFKSFGEKLKMYDEMRDKVIDRDLERLELEKRKEARKQKQIKPEERNIQMQQYKMNWDMLQQLLAKEVRAPWEEYLSKFRAF
uniref:Uncharacterized protein n=1 Tax=Chenopodium quinoa TaxID=63459 RepID=A0A803N7M8_CHEQI